MRVIEENAPLDAQAYGCTATPEYPRAHVQRNAQALGSSGKEWAGVPACFTQPLLFRGLTLDSLYIRKGFSESCGARKV